MVAGSPARTGAARCPGVLELHQAEDGWLARIRLPGGRVSADQLEAVTRLSDYGNGLVEITARANLQVRGLPPSCEQHAASLLGAAGLLPSSTHERLRNILASPFAGRHPQAISDTDGVVAELDRALCADGALASLPERFLFAVDDGSGAMLGQRADVALTALPVDSAGRGLLRLVIDGVPTGMRSSPPQAVLGALEAARAFLAARATAGSHAWRIRELDGGAAVVAAELGVATVPRSRDRRSPIAVSPGALEQRDGRVAVTALAPLGRVGSGALAVLAREHGGEVRVSPWRTVTVLDVAPNRVRALARSLAQLGLVPSPGSGWEGLTACAGLGACAKARIDVRAAAVQRARSRAAGAPAEHWSACERRCGEPQAVPISVAAGSRLVVSVHGARCETEDVEAALALLADERAAQ